jgi:hypothetical protein
MFTSKNLLALAVIAASTTSAALADDTSTSTTTTAPVKKESALKKDAEAPIKGTEKGVKAVGKGTEKVIMAPAHEMGKLMHHGKKAPKAGATAPTDATSTPAQ